MAEKKSTNARNPLAEVTALDTIEHCRAVLSWMQAVNETAGDKWLEFGRGLVTQTVIEPLAHAEAQLHAESRPSLEVANG